MTNRYLSPTMFDVLKEMDVKGGIRVSCPSTVSRLLLHEFAEDRNGLMHITDKGFDRLEVAERTKAGIRKRAVHSRLPNNNCPGWDAVSEECDTRGRHIYRCVDCGHCRRLGASAVHRAECAWCIVARDPDKTFTLSGFSSLSSTNRRIVYNLTCNGCGVHVRRTLSELKKPCCGRCSRSPHGTVKYFPGAKIGIYTMVARAQNPSRAVFECENGHRVELRKSGIHGRKICVQCRTGASVPVVGRSYGDRIVVEVCDSGSVR